MRRMLPQPTRRDFVLASVATVSAATRIGASQAPLTAEAVVSRIRSRVGMPWRETTTDGFKAGDPSTPITGIATTVSATVDVLRRAAAAQQNLVITLEPTFYTANDAAGARAADPVYVAKRQAIDEGRIVVWRFADHWSARRPSEPVNALAAALGWTGRLVPGSDEIYQVPETTLGALADDLKRRLNIRGGLRTVGRPQMRVRAVFVSPGTTGMPSTIANLPRADVIVAGEPREWEVVPYVQDTWAAGQGKGMVAIGRVVSLTPGMSACAAWIRSFVPEVPVTTIALDDPYWSPPV